MLRYGIKDPKIETHESLLAFTEKFNLDSTQIYIFKDTVSYFQSLRDSIFKINTIGTLIFNKQGYFIDNRKTKSCQWSGCAFLDQYKQDSVYPTDSAYQLQSLLQKITPLSTYQQGDISNDFDLTMISIWAKFIGKYNERLFCLSEVAQKHPDLKVRIIYLNVDMLKDWNLRKDQMLR